MADFTIELEDVQVAQPYKLTVRAQDIHSGEGVVDAFIQLKKEGFSVVEEGLCDQNGQFTFSLRTQGVHQLQVSKAGFVEFSKSINFGKGFLQNPSEDGSYHVTLPLLRAQSLQEEEGQVFAFLSSDGKIEGMSLCCTGEQPEEIGF